ncbi:MAG TPA: signal peptidase I [Gaiellaceae bacterium]|nr:signal peptidase I [Gaiellaceae bacterium]
MLHALRNLPRPRRGERGPVQGEPASGRWRPGSLLASLAWAILPTIALVLVGGYVGLGLVRHVNPPAIPVVGTSMQPLLHAGDLVLLDHADPAALRKGDIIAFKTTKQAQQQYHVPGRYVHRIVKIQHGRNGYRFLTKGDNVSGHEPFWTTETNVIGRYSGKVGGAGYPILFLESLQGRILLGAAGVALLLYFLLGALERRSEDADAQAVTMAQFVEEARTLTQAISSAAGTFPAAPIAPAKRLRLSEYELAPVYRAAEEPERAEPMPELVAAIAEYGEHIRSHTAVMQGLAAIGANLDDTTAELKVVLAELTELIRAQRG